MPLPVQRERNGRDQEPRRFCGLFFVGGRASRTLHERVLQRPRLVVLGQEIGEGFVGKLLNALAAVTRQQLKRPQGLGIEANELAGPRLKTPRLKLAPCRPMSITCRLPSTQPSVLGFDGGLSHHG